MHRNSGIEVKNNNQNAASRIQHANVIQESPENIRVQKSGQDKSRSAGCGGCYRGGYLGSTRSFDGRSFCCGDIGPVVLGNQLKKKELLDLVVARSGKKKKDVKPIVEAMLAVLGDAFAEQREMNLQPLGKLKVQRGKELHYGRALVLKLRQKTAKLSEATQGVGLADQDKPATAVE